MASPANGSTRTCPYCGHKSVYSDRTRVPDRAAKPTESDASAPAPEYKPGWTCENKHCHRRYDFN
jgi:DNA-directed RNA polymerase subunit RPC12/RpoP